MGRVSQAQLRAGTVGGLLSLTLFAAAGGACGGRQTLDPPFEDGGVSTGTGGSGGGGSPAADGGVRGLDATTSNVFVPSGCKVNEVGPSVPIIQGDPLTPIAVPCQGSAGRRVLAIGSQAGQGFDWQATLSPPVVWLAVSPLGGASCPGAPAQDITVRATAPRGASPGERIDSTVRVTTSNAAIAPIEIPVTAVITPTAFTLSPDLADFGTVAVGAAREMQVTVTNTGQAPFTVLYATPTPTVPFTLADWNLHGEDAPAPAPVEPGRAVQLTVRLTATKPGSFETQLAISAFDPQVASVPAACGASQPLTLRAQVNAAK